MITAVLPENLPRIAPVAFGLADVFSGVGFASGSPMEFDDSQKPECLLLRDRTHSRYLEH